MVGKTLNSFKSTGVDSLHAGADWSAVFSRTERQEFAAIMESGEFVSKQKALHFVQMNGSDGLLPSVCLFFTVHYSHQY